MGIAEAPKVSLASPLTPAGGDPTWETPVKSRRAATKHSSLRERFCFAGEAWTGTRRGGDVIASHVTFSCAVWVQPSPNSSTVAVKAADRPSLCRGGGDSFRGGWNSSGGSCSPCRRCRGLRRVLWCCRHHGGGRDVITTPG